MPLNPNIPLQVMTPADARTQNLNNSLKQQQTQMNQNKLKTMEDQQGQPDYDEIEKKMDIGMKILSTVRDQASYDRAKQLAGQYGITDLQALPDQYDPAIIDQLGRASMTFAEQMAMQRGERGAQLNREKFEYGKTQDAADQTRLDAKGVQKQGLEERKMDLNESKFGLEMQKHADELDELERIAADPNSDLEPIPVGALKELRSDMQDIGLSGQINADLGVISEQLESGSLRLGPMQNIGSGFKNFVGGSDEVSRNYQSFKSTLQKLRNDSLRLNKGIQTEGDAQRAWDELISKTNDPEFVKQRIGEIRAINERAAKLKKMGADMTLENYGRPRMPNLVFDQPAALGVGQQDATPPPGGSAPAQQQGGGGSAIEDEMRRRGLIE